ncbi:MAG: hypothetical protein ACJ75C_16865 [Actinomycetes bacterium]
MSRCTFFVNRDTGRLASHRPPSPASARRSVELVKDATLKEYPGAPHGLAQVTPYRDQFNAELLG